MYLWDLNFADALNLVEYDLEFSGQQTLDCNDGSIHPLTQDEIFQQPFSLCFLLHLSSYPLEHVIGCTGIQPCCISPIALPYMVLCLKASLRPGGILINLCSFSCFSAQAESLLYIPANKAGRCFKWVVVNLSRLDSSKGDITDDLQSKETTHNGWRTDRPTFPNPPKGLLWRILLTWKKWQD